MKKIFTLFSCLILSFTIFSSGVNAQCATNAYISKSGKCVSLVWVPLSSAPNPLPDNVVLDGLVFAYFEGTGDVADPAVYKNTTAACTVPSDNVQGNVTFNFTDGRESFTCEYPGAVLALQNIQLKAYVKQQQTILEWTADTKDILNFEVQRSGDGKKFNTIASIAAAQHTGAFVYADQSGSKEQYYRLRVVETNQLGWYSKIVRVGNTAESQVSVYPNPAKGSFVLSGMTTSSLKSLNIFDSQGRKIAFKTSQLTSDGSSARITLNTNSKGMIFISWNDGPSKGVLKTTIE